MRLYLVSDQTWLKQETLCEAIEKSIDGGVSCVQVREKQLDDENFIILARDIQKLCTTRNIPCIINDNIDVFKVIDADGIHVGQSDISAGDIRTQIGKDKILGVSVQSVQQALLAQEQGADYLGVGAMFNTSSKDDADDVSIDTLKEICSAVNIPVVAIGGISVHNISELYNSGIDGVAVISAILAKEDYTLASKELLQLANLL